ncbi:MAG: tRNA pseudouridine(55) synthase TruB [Candidatus Aminicenantes bacterium]|nr:MAG: tRNA pseudouridine(55) synthase TruB [Candidatus Aminicenantes bacterium]
MVHGLILVNKPSNITSHTVVEKIRKLFKVKKVGHFGTLDPVAKGILLIGMGNATKFFDFYIKKRKFYSGIIAFGYATTTYDSEGEPLAENKPIDLRTLDIDSLLAGFRGKQIQIPPIYSAKKFKGKPLYKYARENKAGDIEVKPVEVEIFSLQGKVVDETTLWFQAETSSGTYIRSLAHDMGQNLGVGAYLKELVREGVGEFRLENAFTPEELTGYVNAGEISKVVTPIEALLPEFPKIIVGPGGRKAVLNGMPLVPGDVAKIIPIKNGNETSEYFRLFDDEGKLLAIARKDPKLIQFKPYIVFPD